MTSMMMLHLKGFLSLKSHNLYSSFWSKGSINPLNFTPGFKWDLDWQNQEPELIIFGTLSSVPSCCQSRSLKNCGKIPLNERKRS